MEIDQATEKFLKKLGQRLRQIRQEKGWTLEETEEHGWPSWRHLQKIEAGKNVTLATLFKISQVYKVNISDLFKELR